MKKILTIFLLLVCYTASAQYKFPKKELAEEVKNKKIAIQLLEEKGETEKNLNTSLKEAFAQNWSFTTVEFYTIAEIDELVASKSNDYAFLLQQDELKEDKRSGYIDAQGRRHHIGVSHAGDSKFTYTAFTFTYYDFDLVLFKKNKAVNVTSISFANGDLSKIDYIFLAQQLNKLLENSVNGTSLKEYYNVERNIKTLENHKLLLLKDFFKEKDVPEISKTYEYSSELVDFEKYEDAILNKESNTAYVKILWSNQHESYVWAVVDTLDGSILALTGFGGVKFGKHHDADDIIKVKHLKYVTAKGAQSMNNKYK